MKARIYLCVLFIVFTIKAGAQTLVTGTVSDTGGTAIKNASVSLIDKKTGVAAAFGFTGNSGTYAIVKPANEDFYISISSLGYLPAQSDFHTGTFVYNFSLTVRKYVLPEVKVRPNLFITKKGDTLNYNVASFTRMQDRTIGDVIKNLPGITVSPEGTISYNGRPINKFYIDGEDLLGSRYNVALNSLPADVVDKIQVLENHQPVRMLEDKENSDQAAINLKLNAKGTARPFASGYISAGLPGAADVRVNVLQFRPKIKFLNTYSYNNTGQDLKTEGRSQNTLDILTEPVSFSRKPLLGLALPSDPAVSKEYYLNNQTHLVLLNQLVRLNKDKRLRVNVYWLPDKVWQKNVYNTTYFLPADTIKQFQRHDARLSSQQFFGSINYEENSLKRFVENRLSVEYNRDRNQDMLTTEAGPLFQQMPSGNLNIVNQLSIKKSLRKGYFMSFFSNIQYAKLPEQLVVRDGIFDELLNIGQPYLETRQKIQQESASSLLQVSLSRKKDHFLFKLEAMHFFENVNNYGNIELLLPNNTNVKAGPAFQNDLHWRQHRAGITPGMEWSSKKVFFSVSLPVVVRDIHFQERIKLIDSGMTKVSIHPTIRFTAETGKYSKLIISLKKGTLPAGPENIMPGSTITSYRNLSQQVGPLYLSDVYSAFFMITYRNPIKIFFFNAGFIANRSVAPVLTEASFNNGTIAYSRTLFDNTTKKDILLLNISKYIFPVKATIKLGSNITSSVYNQKQNSRVTKIRALSYHFNAAILVKPVWYFNATLNVDYTLFKNSELNPHIPIGKAVRVWNINFSETFNFTKNIFLSTQISLLKQKSGNTDNNIILANAKLNFVTTKSKTDIFIKAVNLFNEKTLMFYDASGNQYSENSYWIRPFTIMAGCSFRL